jgi:hypothetical protein
MLVSVDLAVLILMPRAPCRLCRLCRLALELEPVSTQKQPIVTCDHGLGRPICERHRALGIDQEHPATEFVECGQCGDFPRFRYSRGLWSATAMASLFIEGTRGTGTQRTGRVLADVPMGRHPCVSLLVVCGAA